ncbi:XRE family transcriptional regulator [Lactococcus lactis]
MKNEVTRKIDFLGLFGVIIFNLILGLSLAITVFALLFSLWTITLAFIVSPLIFLTVILLKLQNFAWIQLILSFILCGIGFCLYPIAKKISLLLFNFGKEYIKYNKKSIYR